MFLTSYECIGVEIEGPLAIVTIKREAQRNALNSQTLAELTTVVGELEMSDDIRVVAITGGTGKAFVAGADIAEMSELTPMQAQAFAELGGALGTAIESSAKIYVAAVNGYALGGGCELALCCDFIYASDRATFGQPEVKLGVIPGFGGTQRMLRRLGKAMAKELCLTGDTIDATEALRIRLVNKIVPHDELMRVVRELSARIAKNGPVAVAEAKRVIQVGQSMSLDGGLAIEQRSFGLMFATEDQREGMAAFLAKRPPIFKGR